MSTARRHILLVDMDGPLADFDRHFFDRCAARGIRLDCTLETQTHRFATDHIPDPGRRQEARHMVDRTRWFRDLPVVEGAVEGMNALAKLFDVWVCTKPLEANRWCRDDKAAWLRKHFGREWERKLILAPDKSLVWGDILLDDAIKPEWLPLAEWKPVVYPTPWNGDTLVGHPRWKWGDDPINLLLGAAVEADAS